MGRRYDEETGQRYSVDEDTGVATQVYQYGDEYRPRQVSPGSVLSSLLGNGFGGTAGIVAPGWMHPNAQTGSLMSVQDMLSVGAPDPYELYQGESFSPEQQAARDAFIAQFPGYGQVGSKYFIDRSPKAYGTPGGFLNDPSKVINDPTYGPITTLDNFGYAGGKGGHGDALRRLASMAAMAFGAGMMEPGAGFTDAAAAGSSGLGETIGAGEFGLSGATAGNLAGTGGLSSSAGGLGLDAASGAGSIGLGSGAAGAAAMGAGSGALLTPALAESVGIGAGAYGLGSGGGGLTAAESMGGVATGGAGAPSVPPGSGSLASRILDGTATTADYLQGLGTVGSAALGLYGQNKQIDALSANADKYLAMGAPYRDRLNASYAPGFSMADQPDFQNALDVGAQAAARATSARVGNPTGNPGAYADMQKYISGSLALPQLNTYRSQLGTFGQLGTNTAGSSDAAAAGATGNYGDVGLALGALTGQKSPYENDLAKLLQGYGMNQLKQSNSSL